MLLGQDPKNKGMEGKICLKDIMIFFEMVSQIKDAKKGNIFHDIDNPGVLKWKVFDNNIDMPRMQQRSMESKI